MIIPAIIIALVQPPAQPTAQPAKPPPLATGKYTVLKVSGDLDSDHLVRTVAAELDRARGVALVILELDGNRARPDVVARIGNRIKNSSPPVAVLLKDGTDKKVGIGQALLGGYVKNCFIDPDTRIVGAPGDDLRHLAPAEIKWETIEQEISSPLWKRLTDLSADQSLSQALLSPSHDTWAIPVRAAEPWKLSSVSPAAGQSGPQPRQIIWGDGPRIEIDAEAAVGLRLCADTAPGPAPILASAGLSLRSSRSNRSIESGFTDAVSNLSRTMEDAKVATRRIATTLAMRPAPSRPTVEDYRRAGQSALDQIDRALRELDRADTLLSEFPELNRRHESPTPRTKAGPWRTAIDAIRKDLDKHRTAARDFASR